MFFLSYLNKKCALFLVLVTCCNIQAYIMKITHMYNPAKDQHVFLCGDYHVGKKFGNQRQDFFDAVEISGGKVIVEDNSVWVCANFPDFQPMIDDFIVDPVSFDYN